MADTPVEVAPLEEPSPAQPPTDSTITDKLAIAVAMPQPALVSELEPVRETTELPALPAIASEASSVFSAIPTDASSNHASFSSTPPTTMTDAASVASDTSHKPEIIIAAPSITTALATLAPLDEPPECIEQIVEVGTPHRDQPTPILSPQPSKSENKENEQTAAASTPRRARATRSTNGTPVYNLSKLSGTHIHGKRRANGDEIRERRRRTDNGSADNLVQRGIDALDMNWSLDAAGTPRSARLGAKNKTAAAEDKKKQAELAIATRRSTRASGASDTVVATTTMLGKRGRETLKKIPRELRRLQDTNEFQGIEAKPVLHTIWSNGKYIDPNDLDEDGEPLHKQTRKNAARKGSEAPAEAATPEVEAVKEATPTVAMKQKRVKKWLDKGLYAGQQAPADYTAGLSTADKKKLAQLPELKPSGKVNKTLPLPMFNGLRTLINGRDFKLPFDVCNPLPPGQPKPDEWRKMTKNRFVGDAGTYWRKTDHFKDYQSKCVCKPDDGCAEDCQNRIMLYECDDTNCNVGKEHCQNRAFQNLQERTKKGGRFRVGVEVVKTADRGHGVRSNRSFEPNQIIMEYTGEIITEAECERRMNEKYKDNECYYLMAFDQNMIIDATTGSIARFVNHSCNPNCRMEKWIVHGQPRMALFAGDKPITTGEELTYDYNFDPFSAKNVQKCLCGSANCRGVLGPKAPKGVKVTKGEVKTTIKETVKAVTKAGKRKLKALLDGEEEEETSAAKKRKIAKPASKLTAKATAAVKKAANSIAVGAKTAAPAKNAGKPVHVSVRKATLVKTSKVYTKNGKQLLLADSITNPSTIIAATKKKAPATAKKGAANTASPAKGKVSASKTTIKAAGVKALKSAKHTISKATTTKKTILKKTTTTTTTTAVATKNSITASPAASPKVKKTYGKKKHSGGSISVKGPRKALELSRTQSKIRVVTDSE